MDYKVVSVLALTIASVVSVPYQPSFPSDVDFGEEPHLQPLPDGEDFGQGPHQHFPDSVDYGEGPHQQPFPSHAGLIKPPHPHPFPGVDHGSPKCPCPKIYFPLCGSDGKSYNNMCEFTCQARHVRHLFNIDMVVVNKVRCEEIY